MAKAPKPVALISKHLTKEEIQAREEQEQKLKGNNDKVYKTPKGTPAPVGKIYQSLVKELKAANILNNLDIELLLTTAYAIQRMRESRIILDELGSTIRTYKDIKQPNGEFKTVLDSIFKNPAVQTEKDYQAIFHQGCLQLGLSPSSRAKLALMNADPNINTDKPKSKEDEIFG